MCVFQGGVDRYGLEEVDLGVVAFLAANGILLVRIQQTTNGAEFPPSGDVVF